MEGTMASIYLWAANFAPLGWGYCDGSLQSIANNSALYSLIGTTYGGDGIQTFGLPDFRGRAPIGTGQGPGLPNYDLGQTGGANQVTLNQNQLPAHFHVVDRASGSFKVGVSSNPATTDEADGGVLTNTGNNFYTTGGAIGALGGVQLSGNTGVAGGNAPVNIMPPYLGISYIICMEGIYPSRP